MAIISLAGDAGTRAGEMFRRNSTRDRDAVDVYVDWQNEAFADAAQEAALLAELYYGNLATFTTGGDLIVTVDDVAENGLRWQQLFVLLPFVGMVFRGLKSIKLRIRKGSKVASEITIPSELGDKLAVMPAEKRKELLGKAVKAKDEKEALAVLESGVAAGRATARVKPEFPPPVDAVRVTNQRGRSTPHPNHVKSATSEEAFARQLHAQPDEVVLMWGKKMGKQGPDVISYNLKTKTVTLWDDKFRSKPSRISSSSTFRTHSNSLASSRREAIEAVRTSQLSPEDKSEALRSIQTRGFRAGTHGSGNAKNSTFEYHR
jgi:hypothetical protein